MTSLSIDRSTGLVAGAAQRHSPNQDARPAGVAPELVVVHGISLPAGAFGGAAIDALFTNCLDPGAHADFHDLAALRVSAHLLLRRDGRLLQYVPLTRRAWHAGVSRWFGRERCNDFSIGIEVEGADHIAYDARQYSRLAGLLSAMFRAWPVLDARRVVGHCDIAPGRKTDPGPAFDWQLLHRLLASPPTSAAAGAAREGTA